MKATLLVLLGAFAACGRSKPTSGSGDNAGEGNLDLPLVLPASCASDTAVPPDDLVCTGLYADIDAKVTAPGVVPYAPAVPLWSDGAEKQRWISLPADGVIDNSDPNEWIFPIGTKVWKEFSKDGRRIETRVWQKVHTNYWVDAAYVWNTDESAAARSAGGDMTLDDGAIYHVPTPDECQKCHRGRTEHILGFEEVLLGLPGATGLTLDQLVQQGQLSDPPPSTTLAIGDDGSQAAAPALAWLHVNCGTTCHNGNSGSTAYSAGMLLRLDPTVLDGRPTDAFDQLRTTVGVMAKTPAWSGQTRIVAGAPDQSLLYQLISHRGMGMQMPPIATNVVDDVDVALIQAWIAQMPGPASTPAGGVDDSSAGAAGNSLATGVGNDGAPTEPAVDAGM